jgi:ligand-binding SRPBCC domain-containing protein
VLPAPPETIWRRLSRVETLRYITFPYMVFSSADGTAETEWRAGMTARFRLRLFGIIPLGIHTIRIQKFDHSAYTVQSCEHNRLVTRWNHTITLVPLDGSTHYTDEADVYAGRLTGVVRFWSTQFYRHRQKRWRKLLLIE